MKGIELFSKGILVLRKEIGKLRHYFLAGIFCIFFLALFMYLLGIIVNTVLYALSWFNTGIIYSGTLLLGAILIIGLVINIFGSQKFATSNSFIVIMARSFMKLAEKSKTKDAFKSYKVPLSTLIGIDPIIQLNLAKARLEIKELKLRKKCPNNWTNHIMDTEEFLKYEKLLEKIENEGNKSASIYVFSGNGNGNESEIDGLFSTTPSIITGFPLFGISAEEIEEIDTKIAVSEVTSGTLGK